MQWILPSPLAVGVYSLTYQTKVDTLAPANAPLVNNVQMNYTGAAAPLTSSVPVTVIGNYTVKIDVYNEAGEVVKTLTIQNFTQPVNNIDLQTSGLITTLSGNGSSIDILFAGVVIGTWDGSTNNGTPATNGVYEISVSSVSPTGVTTSVSKQATVSRSLASITVNVYNEAGEVVRKIYGMVNLSTGSGMTNVDLSSPTLKPSSSGSGPSNSIQITVQTTNGPVTLIWDGMSDSSSTVTPGVYQIEVHWSDGAGGTTNITRSIVVMAGGGVTESVVVKPNSLNAANGMIAAFDAANVPNAYTVKVTIYTLTGQLVKVVEGSAGTLTASWDATDAASGLYIAAIEVRNAAGGVIKLQRTKVLVLH
jgi:flagellar hook assembly protein FlgD